MGYVNPLPVDLGLVTNRGGVPGPNPIYQASGKSDAFFREQCDRRHAKSEDITYEELLRRRREMEDAPQDEEVAAEEAPQDEEEFEEAAEQEEAPEEVAELENGTLHEQELEEAPEEVAELENGTLHEQELEEAPEELEVAELENSAVHNPGPGLGADESLRPYLLQTLREYFDSGQLGESEESVTADMSTEELISLFRESGLTIPGEEVLEEEEEVIEEEPPARRRKLG